mgnify:FL=1
MSDKNIDFNLFNHFCPHCGEPSLQGVVTVTYSHVPLDADGYDTITGGRIEEDEIFSIQCSACHKDVSLDHYFRAERERRDI